MKYTKPWLIENSVATDDWHLWLAVNSTEDVDHQLIYKDETVSLHFFDLELGLQFAQEFDLK
jgi:hypothetical protein